MFANLTKKQLDELSHHHWRIFTNDAITQQAITDELARRGQAPSLKTNIFHAGAGVPVFVVDFKMVLFLANLAEKTHKTPYFFTAYHRKSRSGGWHILREGKETSLQKLMKKLPAGIQKVKDPKSKKRNDLVKRSALAAM